MRLARCSVSLCILIFTRCTGASDISQSTANIDALALALPSGCQATVQAVPLAPLENSSADVNSNLSEIVDYDAIADACPRYYSGDDSAELACGKYLFFYEHFDTVGMPEIMLRFALRWYEPQFGSQLQRFGFIEDPARDLPVGLVRSTKKLAGLNTVAFTCAACHFAQTNRGDYAVGLAHLDLEYGRFLINLMAPLLFSMGGLGEVVGMQTHPILDDGAIRQQYESNRWNPLYWASVAALGTKSLGLLIGGEIPAFSLGMQDLFLHAPAGTMDFLTPPIIDDGVFTLSAIPNLFDLPDAKARADRCIAATDGTDDAMLSLSGGVPDTRVFAQTFVAIGKGDSAYWTEARLKPLGTYVQSLRAPPRVQGNDQAIARGSDVFVSACAGCHFGPHGESPGVFELTEDCAHEGSHLHGQYIGSVCTETTYARLFDPDANGVPRNPALAPFAALGAVATFGVKAPRLSAVGQRNRLLHHGGIDSLQELLCTDGPRPQTSECMVRDGDACVQWWAPKRGHLFGCDLSAEQKRDLLAYLRAL